MLEELNLKSLFVFEYLLEKNQALYHELILNKNYCDVVQQQDMAVREIPFQDLHKPVDDVVGHEAVESCPLDEHFDAVDAGPFDDLLDLDFEESVKFPCEK